MSNTTNPQILSQETELYTPELYEQIRDALDLPKGSQVTYWIIEDRIPGKEIYLLHYVQEKLSEVISTKTFKSKFTDKESNAILNLRGFIISLEDPKNPWHCCKSNGYTGQIIANSVGSDIFHGVDEMKNEFSIDVNGPQVVIPLPVKIDGVDGFVPTVQPPHVVFQPFYQGPVLRLWKYKGTTYCSSHHKIFTSKSRWGSIDSFETLFIRYFGNGCKTLEDVGNELFNATKLTSNICYIFILSVPKVSVGSRMNIGAGFLVYIRHFILNQFYSLEAFHYYKDWKEIDTTTNWYFNTKFVEPPLSGVNKVPIPPTPTVEDDRVIIKVPTFNYETANKILSTGYTSLSQKELQTIDERLWPGNAVVMILPYDFKVLKITPVCCAWRDIVMGNNPNIYNQFFHLMELASTPKDKINSSKDKDREKNNVNYAELYVTGPLKSEESELKLSYEDLFPDLGNPTAIEIQIMAKEIVNCDNFIPKVFEHHRPNERKEYDENLSIRNEKIKNISMCYLYAVPYYNIIDAGGYYSNYLSDLDDLKAFFSKNIKSLGILYTESTIASDPRFGSKDGKTLKAAGKALSFVYEHSFKIYKQRLEGGFNNKKTKKGEPVEKMGKKELLIDVVCTFLDGLKGSLLYSLIKASTKKVEE